jgi:energy-coupling factor transporter ATP-binding protein EcfA2
LIDSFFFNLFVFCCYGRKDIEIPEALGSAFLNALDSSRREKAKSVMMSFSERLTADRQEVKEEISDIPLVRQAKELREKLQVKTADLSLRIKDGYFKYTEVIDESQDKKDPIKRIETVSNGAPIQSVWQKLKRLVRCSAGGMKTIEHYPVKNINLYFEQGKTYLVLGAPRSGKSTLLKMIAGILPEDKDREVGGSVTINRFGPKTGNLTWSNFVGYIDQIDRLHPYLTVQETMEFAWKCRTGGTHRTPLMGDGPEIDAEIRKMDEQLLAVMSVMEGMGILRVKDTFVGDQLTVRGVSGTYFINSSYLTAVYRLHLMTLFLIIFVTTTPFCFVPKIPCRRRKEKSHSSRNDCWRFPIHVHG